MGFKRSLMVGFLGFLSVTAKVGAEASKNTSVEVDSSTFLERLKCFEENGYRLQDIILDLEKATHDTQEVESLDMELAPKPGGGQPGVC